VDNTISEFDNPLGTVQGFDPFDTSKTTPFLQQIVDVNLNGGALFDGFSDLHAYAFNWYGGGSLAWAQNPPPAVADRWSPPAFSTTPSRSSL
jgi:hypothetical protein